jgi:hypothetical protein
MSPDEIPVELTAMLDEAAGKRHSATGPVMTALAAILTRYEEIIRGGLADLAGADPGRRRSMRYDPVRDLAALIDGLHELGSIGALEVVLGRILTSPYARLRGGLLLDEPSQGHLSTEDALRELLAGPAAEPPAARVCIVCGQPLPHETCQPVIAGSRTRQEKRS